MIELTAAHKEAIVARVAALERATGVQVVTAVTPRADAYPELVWAAFALGASLAGLAVVAADYARPNWTGNANALIAVATVLGCGAACALAVVLVPPFARLFLTAHRRDAEMRQCAQSLFLEHRLDGTRDHRAVLVLVSLFEGRAEVVADTAFDGRVEAGEWQRVVAATSAPLRQRDAAAALLAALDVLQAVLHERGFAGHRGANELPDAPLTLSAQ